jgi:hypothetical protein
MGLLTWFRGFVGRAPKILAADDTTHLLKLLVQKQNANPERLCFWCHNMHDMQEIFRRLVSSIHIAQKYATLAKLAETRPNLAKTRPKRSIFASMASIPKISTVHPPDDIAA